MSYIPRGKVIVAAVNDNGEGYFEPETPSDITSLSGGGSLRLIFDHSQIPIPGVQYNPRDEYPGVANESGVRFSEAELPAGERSPMHATPSIDLGVIITGSVVLILDSGDERILE